MSSSPAARRWSALISLQQSSGETIQSFCKARMLNPGTLSWWKWKLRREKRLNRPFVELVLTPEPQPPARPNPIILELPRHNAQLVIDQDTDLALLRRVIENLC